MELARHWRLKAARYRLEGQRCAACGAIEFPAHEACQRCGSAEVAPEQLSGRGTLLSWTVQQQAPAGFEDQTPLAIGLVQLEEGPILTAQLTDLDHSELRIDLPLEHVTRKLRDLGEDGLILYGYKFRPLSLPSPRG